MHLVTCRCKYMFRVSGVENKSYLIADDCMQHLHLTMVSVGGRRRSEEEASLLLQFRDGTKCVHTQTFETSQSEAAYVVVLQHLHEIEEVVAVKSVVHLLSRNHVAGLWRSGRRAGHPCG